jgi:uncharacterized Fe-S cluster-containing protein
LQQTETVAKTRHQFAEDLATGINDVLKTVAGKKEEARKKVYVIDIYCANELSTYIFDPLACQLLPKAKVRP